jgi:hypothetical protein
MHKTELIPGPVSEAIKIALQAPQTVALPYRDDIHPLSTILDWPTPKPFPRDGASAIVLTKGVAIGFLAVAIGFLRPSLLPSTAKTVIFAIVGPDRNPVDLARWLRSRSSKAVLLIPRNEAGQFCSPLFAAIGFSVATRTETHLVMIRHRNLNQTCPDEPQKAGSPHSQKRPHHATRTCSSHPDQL